MADTYKAAILASELVGANTVATIDTAGAGGFFAPTIFVPEDTANASTLAGSANAIRACQFVLPFRATVSKVTIECTTLQAATIATVGIYDSSSSKVIDSGTFDVSSTGFKQNSFTAVTLEPGVYYFAWSADGTTAAGRHTAVSLGSSAGTFMNQGTASRRINGTTTSMAGGVLPSSLGTQTDSAGLNCLIAYWEP